MTNGNRLLLGLVLLLPVVSNAFGNLPQVSDLLSKFGRDTKGAAEDPGVATLRELGIKSSNEPKPFSVSPDQVPPLVLACLPAVFRLGSGVFANGYEVDPTGKRESEYTGLVIGNYQLRETSQQGRTTQTEPLVLYEFEQCPFCRKVREAVSILGLTVTYKPCPQDGFTFRYEIKAQFGPNATFPYLQDPNTGIQLFESDVILDYLFRTYGNGQIPWTLTGAWVPVTAGLSLIVGGGGSRKNADPPTQPLELWSYEGSPFCKLVREKLCELEIPHTQISCPRGGPNRQRMFKEKGRFQVPYLEDQNTGVKLWEWDAILEYLQKMYGVEDSPIKYL